MRELIENILTIDLVHARNLVLLDTSFLIAMMEHRDKVERLLELPNIAMTSFNMEELMHVEKHLDPHTRKHLREFLKNGKIVIVKVDAHPGNWEGEKEFVNAADENLLKHIHDPSDAVLLAAAIKTHSSVLTKDKHHLFTVDLANFVQQYDIRVYKELRDIR